MEKLIVCGVSSGTSMDGIDVGVVDLVFDGENLLTASVRHYCEVPFERDLKARLETLVHSGACELQELGRLNMDLGKAFGEAVRTALIEASLKPTDIFCVASHGQTVFHDPPYSTLQIGEPSVIAFITECVCVSDFRIADVARGGQGAPLTSSLDWMLFRPERGCKHRVLLNIGGISNLSLLPPKGCEEEAIGFDAGPGNCLIDLASMDADASLKCDEDGKLGREGTCCNQLLDEMLLLPYFSKDPPKTTGRELFSRELFLKWKQRSADFGLSPQDLISTLTELTARCIADALKRLAPARVDEVYVSGGGSHNPFLMDRLAALLGEGIAVRSHDALGMTADSKEAVLFAVLGAAAMKNIPVSVPSVTGASESCVLGKICPGKYR